MTYRIAARNVAIVVGFGGLGFGSALLGLALYGWFDPASVVLAAGIGLSVGVGIARTWDEW